MSDSTELPPRHGWLKTSLMYATALLFTATVLPASVVGWYYADPQSFGAAIVTAIDYSARL